MLAETLTPPELSEASKLPIKDLREVASQVAKAEINIQKHLEPEQERKLGNGGYVDSTKELLDKSLALIHDKPGLAGEIEDVVLNERFAGHQLPPMMGQFRDFDYPRKKTAFLDILDRDPTLANIIAKRQVAGFHGSRSGSLLNVLRNGLIPASELRDQDTAIVSGERTFSPAGGQKDISFADWRAPNSIGRYAQTGKPVTVESLLEQAENLRAALYSHVEGIGSNDDLFALNGSSIIKDYERQIEFMTDNPDSQETKLMEQNFPVSYGIDVSGMEIADHDPSHAPSDFKGIIDWSSGDVAGEFLARDTITIDKLPVIAVPAEHIEQVRSLIEQEGVNAYVADLATLTRGVDPFSL